MTEVYRRVILKPTELAEQQRVQLAEGLAAAIAWQQELAGASPHVLRLLGALRETDAAFIIDHEPARPALEPTTLFDGAQPDVDSRELLRMAAAIFGVLKAAHASGQRMHAHGGLCPGALLVSPDGIEKVTDFGFAAAVYAAVGEEQYVNLALSPRTEGEEELRCTGAWETLSPDEYERDDRICAFIAPEKYEQGLMGTFEPSSDIIAGGFILHVMAEHSHPYLVHNAEAHRNPTMSQFIAYSVYHSARRRHLQESTDNGVLVWCQLVANMLNLAPRDRPSAQDVIEVLSPYVRPTDLTHI